MYVEARLGDLVVQRLSPVSVDPATGDFSYEAATQNFAVFNVRRVPRGGFSFFCFTA